MISRSIIFLLYFIDWSFQARFQGRIFTVHEYLTLFCSFFIISFLRVSLRWIASVDERKRDWHILYIYTLVCGIYVLSRCIIVIKRRVEEPTVKEHHDLQCLWCVLYKTILEIYSTVGSYSIVVYSTIITATMKEGRRGGVQNL